MRDIQKIYFDWDNSNIEHIENHGISRYEVEDAYLDDENKKVLYDDKHSNESEERFIVLATSKISKNAKEEVEFYDNLDSKYLENLKEVKLDDSKIIPTSKSISIRIPIKLIQKVKIKANSMDVPYQSLIKTYIQKGIEV